MVSLREQLTALYPDNPQEVQTCLEMYNIAVTWMGAWTIGEFIQALKEGVYEPTKAA